MSSRLPNRQRFPRLRRRAALAALPLLVAAPDVARACAVCGVGRDDETRWAFLITTIFMSVLPLTLIGGVAWWLRRAVRRAQRLEPAAQPVVRPEPARAWHLSAESDPSR